MRQLLVLLAILTVTPALAADKPDLFVLGWFADGYGPIPEENCWSTFAGYSSGSLMHSATEEEFNLICDRRIWCDNDVGMALQSSADSLNREIDAISLIESPPGGLIKEVCREAF